MMCGYGRLTCNVCYSTSGCFNTCCSLASGWCMASPHKIFSLERHIFFHCGMYLDLSQHTHIQACNASSWYKLALGSQSPAGDWVIPIAETPSGIWQNPEQ